MKGYYLPFKCTVLTRNSRRPDLVDRSCHDQLVNPIGFLFREEDIVQMPNFAIRERNFDVSSDD